jgi:hypothetical protein
MFPSWVGCLPGGSLLVCDTIEFLLVLIAGGFILLLFIGFIRLGEFLLSKYFQ